MVHLRSVGVLSCARIFGAIHAALGVLVGIALLLFGVVGAMIAPGQQKWGMLAFIIGAVLTPFIYGFLGFIMGAIWAFVYNLAAQSIGGLELQLEAVHTAALPTADAGA